MGHVISRGATPVTMASPVTGGCPLARNLPDFNPFKELGVTASITDEELKKTFHKKLRQCHPDKVMGQEDLARGINDLLKNAVGARRNALGPISSEAAPDALAGEVTKAVREPPLFPGRVWEMILGMLEDSKDIFNVVVVIPELGPMLRKNAYLWRFGEVVPHLLPFLKLEDILACRLVCRRWSRGIDQCLESNPDPNNHQNLARPGVVTILDWLLHSYNYFSGVRGFCGPETFSEFLEAIEGHPVERNPFVGRSLSLQPEGIKDIIDVQRFWERGHQLLQKFGRHLWYLEISNPEIETNPGSYSQAILNYFEHLPNLKHLTFGAGYIPKYTDDPGTRPFRSGATRAVIDFMESGLPPPANLHSLKIIFRGCPLPLLNFILSWLSAQLRKLMLYRYDEPKGFSTLILPKLNDLTIQDSIRKEFLRDLIRKLQAPQVSKLELILMNQCTGYVMETDIFPFLKKFPQLESLTLTCTGDCNALTEEENLSPATNSIPSLKSLTITGNNPGLNFDFLRCFPSLVTLTIYRDSSLLFEYGRDALRPEPTLGISEVLSSGRLYESNVWELLPKLEGITVKSSDGSSMFSRAGKVRHSHDNL